MLKQRVITALVLMAVLLPSLFAASPLPFVVLALVMISAAGWEWARLNGWTAALPAIGSGLLLAGACALAYRQAALLESAALWELAALLWLVGGAAALYMGPAGWPRVPRALRWALGLLLLWLAWAAVARSRIIGINFLLSVMCIVWAADIAAYFGGRAFGKRKLAPSISPGKSWAGVYSGVAAVLLLSLLWLMADARLSLGSPSVFTLLNQRLGGVGMLLALVLLAGLSVVGDLFESLVKRAASAKDSSNLLPGHGGVLDRLDALLPVMPTALALITL